MVVRLLPKSEVDKRKAEEQRRAIVEGVKVAERVDSLRETLAKEETAFENYRTETLKGIVAEVQAKYAERDKLDLDIATRRAEWNALLEPLDKNWQRYVSGEKARIEQQVKDNDTLASQLSQKLRRAAEEERSIGETKKALELEQRKLDLRSAATTQKEKQAEKSLADAQKQATRMTAAAELRDKDAQKRLNEAIEYEKHLEVEKQKLAKEKEEMTAREFKVLAKELQFYSPIKKL